MWRTIAAGAVLMSLCGALNGGQVGGSQAVPRGTASVTGRVVDEETGAAVPKGSVTLRIVPAGLPPARQGPHQLTVTADAEGRFSFNALPGGSLSLLVSAPGYVSATGLPGSVQLVDGTTHDVSLRLVRVGEIGGLVRTTGGIPVPGALVRVVRALYLTRHYTTAAPVMTDQEGRYRAGNLAPGEYLVVVRVSSASAPRAVMELARNPDGLPSLVNSYAVLPTGVPAESDGVLSSVNFDGSTMPAPEWLFSPQRAHLPRTTFHPKATSIESAHPVALPPGATLRDVDVELQIDSTHTVAGTLVAPDGLARHIGVRLSSLGSRDTRQIITELYGTVATAITDQSGQFSFLRVPKGRYTLRAFLLEPRVSPPSPTRRYLALAERTVDVASDVTLPPITLTPPAVVRGQIAIADDSTVPSTATTPTRFSIRLENTHTGWVTGPHVTGPDAAGRFEIINITPGRYGVDVTGPGSLRSAMIGESGRPVRSLQIVDGAVGDLRIVMATTATHVVTLVKGASATPVPRAHVVLFPRDYEAWMADGMPSLWQKQARTGVDGFASIGWVPEGDYLIAAFRREQDLVPDMIRIYPDRTWLDRRLVLAAGRNATPVTLKAGSTVRVELALLGTTAGAPHPIR